MGTESKRILVIQTAFLGDVVLTTPLFRALRDRFPSAYIAALVIPGLRGILDGHPSLNEVLIFDKKGTDRGWKGLLHMAGLLRKGRFDLALLPHRSFRSALAVWLAGIPARIGFLQSPGAPLYTKWVWREPSRHEVQRNMALLGPLGINPSRSEPSPWVATDGADRDWAENRLAAQGVGPGDILIGIAPGSVWATKRWTPEGFAAVVDSLIRDHRAKVLLLGSPGDLPVVEQVASRCREKPVNLAGQTSLRQLAALLSRCRLLITNDNGAMHVGAAQGVPIVAMFGSTTPGLGYGPFSPNAVVVEEPLDCRPCGRHGHPQCPLGHFNCMKKIAPETVMDAAVSRMGRTAA